MAQIGTISIPNADLPDVIEALSIWKADAIAQVGGGDAFDNLPDAQKVRQLLVAVVRTRTRNVRRERAERTITIPDVGVT